jgi:hypothetical protein
MLSNFNRNRDEWNVLVKLPNVKYHEEPLDRSGVICKDME